MVRRVILRVARGGSKGNSVDGKRWFEGYFNRNPSHVRITLVTPSCHDGSITGITLVTPSFYDMITLVTPSCYYGNPMKLSPAP